MSNAKEDIIGILKSSFETRLNRNSRYSLRAFARDLGVSSPWLTRILNGERGISGSSAARIATKLGLTKAEKESFILLADASYGRSKHSKALAKKKLGLIKASHYSALDIDSFKIISEWYHLALLSYLETIKDNFDISIAAKSLGISKFQTQQALDRLLELKMVSKEKDRFTSTGVFFANPVNIPSYSIRSFHRQILEKSIVALEEQSITDQRHSTALVLAVDKAQLEEARSAIKKFTDDFELRFCSKTTKKNQVSALTIQYFKITKEEEIK